MQVAPTLDESAAPPRRPMGAQAFADGVAFTVWAPERRAITLVLESGARAGEIELDRNDDGFFSAFVKKVAPGDLYRYRINGGPLRPDPASRFQPEGPHGPSEVIDLRRYAWSDQRWRGVAPERQVLYEMHVGTFTPEGTWRAACGELRRLADLGITVIEVMPVAEFDGGFGWGYDGVQLFAPYHGYGRPEEFCRFVDSAHALGIGVIVDVVYNHFGASGNYTSAFTREWTAKRPSEWGDAPNFEGTQSGPVRAFYVANAAYWIEEFHADGLRLDATQQIRDTSPEHILRELVRGARDAAPHRRVYIVAENQAQRAKLVQPAASGGHGCDALWNDDFHHAMRVALTGRRDAYYADYEGSAQEILSTLRHGFLFQGQHSAWIDQPLGTAVLDRTPTVFVNCLQNHDQVANAIHGERLTTLAAPDLLRAATALLLLAPQTPMIFQGQEYGSARPFLYFADHEPELAQAVRKGRAQFLAQFAAIDRDALTDPSDPQTFRASTLDPAERTSERGVQTLALFGDLLRLRREDAVIGGSERVRIDGAVLAPDAFALRYFGANGDDRLLIVNFGRDIRRGAIAEPMLAPPDGRQWRLQWSSENVRYGGSGAYPHDE
ncbi:MAG TPA: malto-oligosyltrehalose trehalohydrolase, partial [Rudaea sp.]